MSRLLGLLYRVSRLSSPSGSAARLLLLRPAPVAVAAHQRQRFDDAGSSAPEGWAFYGAAAAAIAAAASPRRFEMTGLPGGGEGDEKDGVVRGADRGELARLARDESGAPDQGGRADDEAEEEAEPPAGKSTAHPLFIYYLLILCHKIVPSCFHPLQAPLSLSRQTCPSRT